MNSFFAKDPLMAHRHRLRLWISAGEPDTRLIGDGTLPTVSPMWSSTPCPIHPRVCSDQLSASRGA